MGIKRLRTDSLNDPEEGISFRQTSDQSLVISWKDYRNTPASVEFHGVDRFAYQVEPMTEIEGLGRHEGSLVEVVDSDYLRAFIETNYESTDVPLRLFYLSTNIGEWCEIVALGYKSES